MFSACKQKQENGQVNTLTSANRKARLWFGLDKQYWALVLTSSKYFQSAAARAVGNNLKETKT